jgi:hypothetical protein
MVDKDTLTSGFEQNSKIAEFQIRLTALITWIIRGTVTPTFFTVQLIFPMVA